MYQAIHTDSLLNETIQSLKLAVLDANFTVAPYLAQMAFYSSNQAKRELCLVS